MNMSKIWSGPSFVGSLATRIPAWASTRRRAAMVVIDGFFEHLAGLSRYQPYAQARRHRAELIRDVPYLDTGLTAHKLDVYRPTSAPGPWPIVLYVHGGGFRILSKDSHWLMALMYARRGFLVFNVNYRLAPEHKYPAAIEDVAAAFRWVVRNAEAFGGDLSRLVFAGESAGANLVTALSVMTSFRRPEPWARETFDAGVQATAVLPACGILQVSDVERLERKSGLAAPFINDYLHVLSDSYLPPPEQREVSLDLADPVCVLESDTPSDRPLPAYFAMVGGKDPLVDDTMRLLHALERRGADVESKVYPGEPHAFHAYIWRHAARQSWRDSFEFLSARLGTRAAAPAASPEAEDELSAEASETHSPLN